MREQSHLTQSQIESVLNHADMPHQITCLKSLMDMSRLCLQCHEVTFNSDRNSFGEHKSEVHSLDEMIDALSYSLDEGGTASKPDASPVERLGAAFARWLRGHLDRYSSHFVCDIHGVLGLAVLNGATLNSAPGRRVKAVIDLVNDSQVEVDQILERAQHDIELESLALAAPTPESDEALTPTQRTTL